jgi:hypothetical protein
MKDDKMEYFLAFLTVIGIVFFYINRNYFNDYIKTLWKEHFCNYINNNNPSFCFECRYSECYKCEPLKLWKKGKKKEAWDKFRKNEMFK